MKKHKDKSLETDCLCSKCVFRFQCFTQERIFSDPIFQGLFEALMAQGKSKEEALDSVSSEIKFRMNKPFEPNTSEPLPGVAGTTTIDMQPWITYYNDGVSFNTNNVSISYTMYDGKEVNWQHNFC